MILSNRYSYSEDFIKRCEDRLDEALQHVPAYAPWASLDPGPGHSLDERYDALPELDKEAMRRSFPDGLMPRGRDLGQALANDEVEYTFTSGTTSEKVINIFDQGWWSASEQASWKLNAHLAKLPYPQRTAKLASSLNVGINCEEDLPMDHRILGDTLYLNEKTNMIQWQPRHYARMAAELDEYRPAIIEANPSLLARLCRWANDHGVSIASPEAIVFTFEFPSKVALAEIRQVFDAPFVSSYGSTETGFVLESCEDGLLHQNVDFCRIDYRPLKEEFGGPDIGRIVVTTFDNPWNCIVRFDVGDMVRLHPEASCSCGRCQGMVVEDIEGRTSNLTFTVDGRPVTTRMLDERIAQMPQVRDYRLEQRTPDAYELQAVLSDSSPVVFDAIRDTLASLYGQGEFTVACVDDILPGPAGKFRRTQADFDYDWKGLFA